jgi:mono/diheme cytochrome c family protein
MVEMVVGGPVLPVPGTRGLTASLESCAVRRAALIGTALAGVLAFAGCGAQGVASPTPKTVIGKSPTAPQLPIVPAFHLKGDATSGKAVFASAGCGGCHTLAAANSNGTIGPNLDTLKPDYRTVTAQVTNGGGSMPSFKSLGNQKIADVSAYVVTSTGGKLP